MTINHSGKSFGHAVFQTIVLCLRQLIKYHSIRPIQPIKEKILD